MAQHATIDFFYSTGADGSVLSFSMHGTVQNFTKVASGPSAIAGTFDSAASLYDAVLLRAAAAYVVSIVGSQITVVAKSYNSSYNFGTWNSGATGISLSSQIDASGVDLTLSTSQTNETVASANDGTISLTPSNGQAPYTYAWGDGPTTQNRSGLAPGSYSVVVSDTATGGAPSQTFTVLFITIDEAPEAIEYTSEVTQIECYNAHDGAISLNITAGDLPFTFLWSDGATTQNRTGLAPGSYSVVLTSAEELTAEVSFEITQPSQIVITPVIAGNDITLEVTGGVAPYTFLWNDGNTSATRISLAVGSYSCTVTDANGCSYANININIGD